MEKKGRVKSHYRKGRLVKAHNRKNNRAKKILIGGSILTIGGLLGKNKISKLVNLIKNKPKINKNILYNNKPYESLDHKPKYFTNITYLNKNLNNPQSTNKVFLISINNKIKYFKETGISNIDNLLTKFKIGSFPHGNEQATENLVSKIAKKAKIRTQDTKIISASTVFENKTPNIPGTFHTKVEGNTANNFFKDMDFVVSNIEKESNFDKILNNMLFSEDTAKIAALDIFTGNADRTANNLIYNKINKSFTAIDNGSAYTLPFDYNSLFSTIKNKKLNENQKRNFDVLINTLKKLKKENSINSLIKLYEDGFYTAVKGLDKRYYNKALESKNFRINNIIYSYQKVDEFLKDY